MKDLFGPREAPERAPEDRELFEVADRLTEDVRRDLMKVLEDGDVDMREIEALELAMNVLDQATESPEAMTEYIRKYVLNVDAAALAEHGFTLDSEGAVQAQTQAARERLAGMRQEIEKFKSVLEDVRASVNLEQEHIALTPEAETGLSTRELEFQNKLRDLDLPESMRESFLGKALQAKQDAAAEVLRLNPPEARLREALTSLFSEMRGTVEAMLLTAETSDLLATRAISVAELLALSDTPLARLFDHPQMQALIERIGLPWDKIFEGSENLGGAEKAVIAAIAVIASGAVVAGAFAPIVLTAGMATPVAVASAAWGLANFYSLAAVALAKPVQKVWNDEVRDPVRGKIVGYSQALESATGKSVGTLRREPVRESEPVSAARAASAQNTREL